MRAEGTRGGLWQMALKALDGSDQRYSEAPPRSLIAMISRRANRLVNRPASHALVRPFVVLAARVLGPGPTRLRLVKLAHTLDGSALFLVPDEGVHGEDRTSVQPASRAA